jgi:hypothetical protein
MKKEILDARGRHEPTAICINRTDSLLRRVKESSYTAEGQLYFQRCRCLHKLTLHIVRAAVGISLLTRRPLMQCIS